MKPDIIDRLACFIDEGEFDWRVGIDDGRQLQNALILARLGEHGGGQSKLVLPWISIDGQHIRRDRDAGRGDVPGVSIGVAFFLGRPIGPSGWEKRLGLPAAGESVFLPRLTRTAPGPMGTIPSYTPKATRSASFNVVLMSRRLGPGRLLHVDGENG